MIAEESMAVRDGFSDRMKPYVAGDSWMIEKDVYKEEDILSEESLFCLSNGYLGTRGSHEEGTRKSIPCTYVNGVFDRSETFMRELANLPNWLGLRFYVEKELIGIGNCEVLKFRRALNMRDSLLVKQMVLRDPKGRETLVEGVRMVSRAHVHRMAIRIFLTPLNYEGIIEVENIIDGSVINFCDAPRFKVKHIAVKENEPLSGDREGAYIGASTRDRNLHVGVGSYTEAYQNGEKVMRNRQFRAFGEQAVEFQDFVAQKGKATEIVKYVSIYTEREVPAFEIHSRVNQEIAAFRMCGWDAEMKTHKDVYAAMWEQADIRICGDAKLDRAVRFNIFHLMSTGNEHDSRVNVGAKLLHGEEYGGHAFWDTELFMLPFFAYVFPKTAANLESYRYHLLDAARENAKKNGYQGAQYPWESADDGTEQCPDWTIEPDGSCYRCYVAVYEHHVTAAVAYGIYNYVKITGDYDFLYHKGAEILVETARFWNSRCEYNEAEDRYEILQVTGPDEWHEPVNNNLYTNYLARWNLRYVKGLMKEWKEEQKGIWQALAGKLSLSEAELDQWQAKIDKMYLPHQEGSKLLEQFEGYFNLKEVMIEEYDENDWPVRPAVLKAMRASETQIIKQADVVMLLHLMGEEFNEETKKINYEFYEKRSLHGSSLSPSIYAIMGLVTGDDSKAYRYLRRAAFIDLRNLQKNTREGIHAANAGGVWQTVVFGFAGISMDKERVLCIDPHMPKEWEGVSFRLHHEGSWLDISIDGKNAVNVKLLAGEEIVLKVCGEKKKAELSS